MSNIPEVESAVGKLGRVMSPLDPAPVSMIETIITIKPEYIVDESGKRMRFLYDRRKREFVRDSVGELIPDPRGADMSMANLSPAVVIEEGVFDVYC